MTTPSIEAVAAYWADRKIPGTDYVPCVDKGEPDCFACGTWGRYDAEQWDRQNSWERGVTLERAHVIPSSLGGSDEPPNIVLLCHDCHADAPDTAEPRYMWHWIAAHPRTGDPLELFFSPDFRKAAKSYTGSGREMARALASFSDDQLKTMLDVIRAGAANPLLGFTFHWKQGAGRSDGVSEATWRAVLGDLLCRTEGTLFLAEEAG